MVSKIDGLGRSFADLASLTAHIKQSRPGTITNSGRLRQCAF